MRKFSALILVFILVIQGWMITDGSGRLFDSEPHFRSTVYDSLARSLSAGKVTVDHQLIGYEGMIGTDGTVMYFGALPALLRIPLTKLLPAFEGRWSKALVIFSSALVLLSIAALFSHPALGLSSTFKDLLILGTGLGSPVFFLSSDSSIYHEAILWGLCGSLWALVALVQMVTHERPDRRFYLLFALGTSIALLSRVTFALPLLIASSALVIDRCRTKSLKDGGIEALLFFLPLLPAVLFQLWYNYARFGSAFTLINYTGFHARPELMGGEFNVFRIFDTLLIWFVPRLSNFSLDFPFIHTIPAFPLLLPGLFTPWVERVIALPLSSSWCFAAGVLGAAATLLHFRRQSTGEIIILVATFISCLVILSFYFTPERYIAEFLPFLFLGGWFFFRASGRQYLRLISCLIVISIATTILSTIDIHLMAVADVGGVRKNRSSLYQLYHPTVTDYRITELDRPQLSGLLRANPKTRCAAIRKVNVRGAQFVSGIRQRMNCSVVIPLNKNITLGVFSLKNQRHLCEGNQAEVVIKDADSGVLLTNKVLSDRGVAERIDLKTFAVRAVEISWRSRSLDLKNCSRGTIVLGEKK